MKTEHQALVDIVNAEIAREALGILKNLYGAGCEIRLYDGEKNYSVNPETSIILIRKG